MLLVAALAAAPALHAQQQEPPAQPSGPEQLFEAIGNTLRDFFRGIFGTREAELPAPQPAPSEQEPPQPAAEQPRQPAPAQQTAPPAPAQQAAPQTPEPPPAAQAPMQQAPAQAPAAAVSPKPTSQPLRITPRANVPPQSLHGLIANGEYDAALKMLDAGTDIEAKDPGAGASALHYAVMKGTLVVVNQLLTRGADVNSRTKSGTTPLHTAALYNRYEVAEALLARGADADVIRA